MIDDITLVVHFKGCPSIFVPFIVLLEYVRDLFLYLAVLILVFHMLDVVRYVDRGSFAISNSSVLLCSCLSSRITCTFCLGVPLREPRPSIFFGKHSPLSTFVNPLSDPLRPSAWSVSEACRYSCGLVSRHIALPNLLRDKCAPTTWFDDGHIHRTPLPLHCNSFLLSAWFQQPSVGIHLCISCSVSLSAYKITQLVNSIPHVWQMGCRSH